MPRPSRLLWIIAVLLLAWALFSVFFGYIYVARSVHGSDVHRDDVGAPFMDLVKAGAVDHDKVAAIYGMPAYAGTTPAERASFEDDVQVKAFFALTNGVAGRVEHDWSVITGAAWISAGVCSVLALATGVQAWRVGDLYE